ncbi:MAG: hypothetical protein ACQESR_01345 [Planctomycetota bacterium]
MESCSTQAALPLIGLAADQVIRDRYKVVADSLSRTAPERRILVAAPPL